MQPNLDLGLLDSVVICVSNLTTRKESKVNNKPATRFAVRDSRFTLYFHLFPIMLRFPLAHSRALSRAASSLAHHAEAKSDKVLVTINGKTTAL